MIKDKYKVIEIVKESENKRIQKAIITNKKQIFVLKSYGCKDDEFYQNELNVYKKMKEPYLHGFAQIKQVFQHKDRIYLVFTQLGDNLEYLRKICGGRLTLKTVLMVGLQILDRIQFMHTNQILHGDIKPSNWLMGLAKLQHKVYLVDFEFSIPYIVNGNHILSEIKQSFRGSLRFCSRSTNSNHNICRKDQLQSWLYCLIYLLKGDLPWTNFNAKTFQQAYKKSYQLKINSTNELFMGIPEIFKKMLAIIDGMKFNTKPNYEQFRKIMLQLMKKNGYEIDYKFDWNFL